jgi:hypothetical protein
VRGRMVSERNKREKSEEAHWISQASAAILAIRRTSCGSAVFGSTVRGRKRYIRASAPLEVNLHDGKGK